MPTTVRKVSPHTTRGLKTTSLRRMLSGLTRADVFRRLRFYGTLCSLMVAALIYCGSTRPVFAAGPERVGLPWDWSHEHLVFSKTNDPAVLAIIQKDPRAFHQWLRRNRNASQGAAEGDPISFDNFLQVDGALFERPSSELGTEPRPASGQVKQIKKKDWGVSLGATNFNQVSATNAAPSYPSKYTFDLNALPSCQNDYVVFPTSALGTSGQASIVAYNNLYSTQVIGTPGGYCESVGPTVYWAYINAACPTMASSDPILSSPVISLDGTKVAWVTTTGKVQILAFGSGAGESVTAPACISSVNGSLPTGGDGASLQTVTLVNAKGNPTVSVSEIYVDYTSDSAYVGDDDGYLHKISPFFGAKSGTLAETIASAWQPSHAYSVNSLILDSNGFIEKCTTAGTSGPGGQPIWSTAWNAATADNTVTWTNIGSGGGWPVYVTGSSTHLDNVALNGPIFDFVSKNVLVGDQNGSLYYVLDPGLSPAVGSCVTGQPFYPCVGTPGTATGIAPAAGAQTDCATASPAPTCLVMSDEQGFTDPLVVDSSDGLVITQFSDADGTNATVEQTNTSLSAFNSTILAGEVKTLAHHTGAFDNNYFNNPTTGFYYVCGPNALVTDLYRVGFTNTGGTIALGSVNGTPLKLTTTGSSGNCSPLAENYNTSTAKDWLFLSLDNHGKTTGCGNGSCVMSLSLQTAIIPGINSSYGPGVAGDIANMNGTGGMVVDNEAPVSNTTASPVISASESGTTATITTSTTLGVVVGQTIKVAGMAKGLTGYNTTPSAAVTCVGALCATGATASSISYTASSGLASCSSAATCAGKANGIGFEDASSFYFMPVANTLTCGDGTAGTGCGVKLTQAGLK